LLINRSELKKLCGLISCTVGVHLMHGMNHRHQLEGAPPQRQWYEHTIIHGHLGINYVSYSQKETEW